MSEKKSVSRRDFLARSSALGLPGLLIPGIALTRSTNIVHTKRPEVLFFDVNETILDLKAMKVAFIEMVDGRKELLPLWFTTMLQYSLVATTGKHYNDFGSIGAAALQMVAANNGLQISKERSLEFMESMEKLPPHPEVKEALALLQTAGFRMVSFTNSTYKVVQDQLQNSGLKDFFETNLSIDDIGKFKPDRDAYDWAARKLQLAPQDCCLIAAHGWDIAGAVWAGWKTAFISRPGQQLYPLAKGPDISEPNLIAVAQQLIKLTK